jgi:hypothetical protein
MSVESSNLLPPETSTTRERYTFLWGLLGFFGSLYLLRNYFIASEEEIGPYGLFISCWIVILSTSIPMLLINFFVHRVAKNSSSGLVDRLGPVDLRRVLIKWLGLLGTIGIILAIYWIFPEYHAGFYTPFKFCAWLLPWILVGAFPYMVIVDRRMKDPLDGYWMMGCLFIGRWKELKAKVIRAYALGWLVKAFFLPLMFVYLSGNLKLFLVPELKLECFMHFFRFSWNLIFLLDVLFACLGYLMTFRLFDSHIRSTDPTFFGWFVALFCYEPFGGFFSDHYLGYRIGQGWESWLEGISSVPLPFGANVLDITVVQMIWGSVILALLVVYVWGTLVFGFRFSNLTHRGIITHGPFRYTKHPAYLCKNISWWLTDIPYLAAGGWTEVLRHSLLLVGFNLIYWFRAKTEERHLSADPDYVAYSKWIDRHGVIAKIRRKLFGR